MSCATGFTGSANYIVCQMNGIWTTPTGCVFGLSVEEIFVFGWLSFSLCAVLWEKCLRASVETCCACIQKFCSCLCDPVEKFCSCLRASVETCCACIALHCQKFCSCLCYPVEKFCSCLCALVQKFCAFVALHYRLWVVDRHPHRMSCLGSPTCSFCWPSFSPGVVALFKSRVVAVAVQTYIHTYIHTCIRTHMHAYIAGGWRP
jgi:hypothetical protein